MLHVNNIAAARRVDHGDTGTRSLSETINTAAGIVRRQFPMVIVIAASAVVLGLVYLLVAPSRYTATATMVIDTRKVQVFQQQSVLGDVPIDAGTVQTEVEILKSQNISAAVIKDLHLTVDPEFVAHGSGLIGAVVGAATSLFTSGDSLSETDLEHRALTAFEKRRTVSRVGLTYVMQIAFQALDPDKAARIANAIANAYITDQLEAKYQATRRAGLWLQDRIRELRIQATAADRAVVDFKQKNNINTVDGTGKLMNEQQMSEVNSQLILAHAASAEARARLDRINEIMKQPIPDASVADALKSEVIIKLRSEYLELAGREALWSAKYGRSHLAALSLRNQMQELRRNIADEMQKIAESYKSDYAISQAREDAIKSSLDASVTESHSTNQAQIQLRELQDTAQSYRSMYDNFLQRHVEAVQQESFPITEARVISPAAPPLERSSPSTLIVLAATLVAGVLVSFGAAFLRELADRVFRTGHQVEEKLQVNCLAMLPAVDFRRGGGAESPADPVRRHITTSPSLQRYAVEEPFSRFAEGLRAVKVAVDVGNVVKTNIVIGVTSTLPNEGKSTASANFAQLMAHAGSRVLLVDADLRNPSLSRTLAAGAAGGLIDVVAGRMTLEQAVWIDPVSNLYVLPTGRDVKLLHTSEMLSSERMRKFFAGVRERFDYVVVDLSPLTPVVDARTTVNFVDSYVLVIEWGRTRIDVVEHSLGDARAIHERILGVIMNKADLTVLNRYERHRSDYDHRKYDGRYGTTA